ncbi:unnamed protein product [Rotaria sp. Silwood2]|nr:unnamed protein product [Rotaria sp. Silwood2]CAF3257411.1 unnamed protein product [Rotaria sp. Silwood2]CAF3276181.1 unnamed protein product [Rotaria sp. Silwood2]CAF4161018.1 unnamed protein product [Rotaria sp. Silwood2]
MITRLEILPNEILICILSHLFWDEMLISFWSLNKRLDFLICSTLETNNNSIIINRPGLSYDKFSRILFPLFSKSSSLISSIRRIHLDGRYSNSCDFLNNNKYILCFPNLKSLNLTRYYISEVSIQNLSSLIEHQLKELTLTLDEDIFAQSHLEEHSPNNIYSQGTFITLFIDFLSN